MWDVGWHFFGVQGYVISAVKQRMCRTTSFLKLVASLTFCKKKHEKWPAHDPWDRQTSFLHHNLCKFFQRIIILWVEDGYNAIKNKVKKGIRFGPNRMLRSLDLGSVYRWLMISKPEQLGLLTILWAKNDSLSSTLLEITFPIVICSTRNGLQNDGRSQSVTHHSGFSKF